MVRAALYVLLLVLTTILVELVEAEGESSTGIQLLQYGAIVALVVMSGLFSGLTLGLMGLDKIGLEIVIGAGEAATASEKEKLLGTYAKKISPVRENGNLLLTTLLLGNVAVNALLSILMADLTSGLVGFLSSTAVIVVFGEILPQAVCSRYALQIGSRVVPLVRVIMGLMYLLAKPISMALDWVLGEEIGTIHTKHELAKMLEIHVHKKAIDDEEGHIMHGAISYKNKEVRTIMTPMEEVFTLPVTAKLNFVTIRGIFKSGFSRIPVWGKNINDIVGLLFVKDLIFIDPEDETPVLNFIHIFGRGVHKVWPDSKLGDVLKLFKMGRGHMALVYDVNNSGEGDPFYEIRGLVTLEDIIEEIIQDEIVDETDVFVEVEKRSRVSRCSFDYGRLRLLDSRIVDDRLSREEVKAVAAHLLTNYRQFSAKRVDGDPLSLDQVEALLNQCPVKEYDGSPSDPMVLYEPQVVETMCTVILQGKAKIVAGREGFESEAGPWSVLAADALIRPEGMYMPDFKASVVSGKVRCLRIARVQFQQCLYPLHGAVHSSVFADVSLEV